MDAEAFCDAVVAREVTRLAELSDWVLSTRGPWEQLDGGLGSVVPLWEWFIRFVDDDCPGVPRSAAPQWWFDDDKPRPPGSFVGYALEGIGHYVMLVVRGIDPAAHWAVYDRMPDANLYEHQRPWILLGNGNGIMPVPLAGHLISEASAVRDRPDKAALRDPGRLHDRLAAELARAGVAAASGPGAGPALPPPQPTPDPPRVWWSPPGAGPVPAPRTAVEAAAGDPAIELALFRGDPADLDVDRLHRLDELDRRLILDSLAVLGFRPNDEAEAEEVDDVQVETWWLEVPAESLELEAELYLAGGALRYFTIAGVSDPAGPTQRRVVDGLRTLARQARATLVDQRAPDRTSD